MTARNVVPILLAICLSAHASERAPIRFPLWFEPNVGQTVPQVPYVAHGSNFTLFLAPGGATLRTGDCVVRMSFVGSNPLAEAIALDPLDVRAHYLIGDAGTWHTNVPAYGRLEFADVYPGIDIVYYGDPAGRLEYDVVVHPGADPSQVGVRFEGAEAIRTDTNRDIVLRTPGGEWRHTNPGAYQVQNGSRRGLAGQFALRGPNEAGFDVPEYDRSLPLVIDPVLAYSTYLGGTGGSYATAIALDAAGNAYVTGATVSLDFPETPGTRLGDASGADVYVAKLSPAGNLLFVTYLGGSGEDEAYGIAVDGMGSAVVAGRTYSTDFAIVNASQARPGGGRDGFVAKLNLTGSALVFSTYLGGSGADNVNAVAVDQLGNIYVAGETTSPNFPIFNGFQAQPGGQGDAFVAKFAATGAKLYATYLGGLGEDSATGIAVDGSGNTYITGSTYSANFPVVNAFQSRLGGGQDAFAAKIGPSGNTLIYSTFLGGSGGASGAPESGNAIVVDSAGCVYIAGTTSSANFPTLNPLQSSLSGLQDAFVLKLSAAGNALVYGTYLGGSSLDIATAIAVDGHGGASVAGYTASTDFPVVNAVESSNAGGYDAFVATLNPAGSALTMSTYLGGTGSDSATGIAEDSVGNLYVAGQTLSPDFPLSNAIQTFAPSGVSGFVARLGNVATQPPVAVSVTPSSGTGSTQAFTFVFSDPNGASSISQVYVLFSQSGSLANACLASLSGSALQLLNDSGGTWLGPITVGGTGSVSNSQCSISASSAAVVSSAQTLTLNLAFSFQPSYTGTNRVYLNAMDTGGQTSGWVQLGTWTISPRVAVATFAKLDSTTLGSWKASYGLDGSAISMDSANYPSYAQVTVGGTAYAWNPSTTDVRALQKYTGSSRIASTWYGLSAYTIDVNLTDSASHQIAIYCLDWDSSGRSERVDVLDAGSGGVLDSRTISSFNSGVYLVWTVSGHVTFRVTPLSNNAVVSGVFFGVQAQTAVATATFSAADTTTHGSWKGAYGLDGSAISMDSTNYPSYAQVTVGGAAYTWNSFTTDVRALQQYTGSSRIASTWYGLSSYTIDVNLTDSASHKVAIYCLDWDNGGRNERVDVLDAGSGNALDTRTISSFSAGVYLVWTVSGHVTFRVTPLSNNAVVSGVFFGVQAQTAVATATFSAADTTTHGSWKGAYGLDGSAISMDSANYPSYAQVTVGGTAYTWSSSTTDVRALQQYAGTNRIASTWYGLSSYTIDVNLTDGASHRIAIYCLDWDNGGRNETVNVLDAGSGSVLDTRTVSSFNSGVYLVWTVSGHVTFRVTPLSNNAVVSGVFFR